jgi:hypothetical protein
LEPASEPTFIWVAAANRCQIEASQTLCSLDPFDLYAQCGDRLPLAHQQGGFLKLSLPFIAASKAPPREHTHRGANRCILVSPHSLFYPIIVISQLSHCGMSLCNSDAALRPWHNISAEGDHLNQIVTSFYVGNSAPDEFKDTTDTRFALLG